MFIVDVQNLKISVSMVHRFPVSYDKAHENLSSMDHGIPLMNYFEANESVEAIHNRLAYS